MTPPLWLDTETYSPVPIKFGTFRYASECEVLLVTYAFGDEDPKLWDVASGDPIPGDIQTGIEDDTQIVVAHNAQFDREVLISGLGIHIPIARWYDTSIQARMHSLPGSLADIGEILGIREDLAKSKEGKRLMRLFCIPPAKNLKRERATWKTHPEEWAEFCEYAKQDIVSMRAIHRALPKWNFPLGKPHIEVDLWRLDQRINRRGVQIDMDLVKHALRATDAEKLRLKSVIAEQTGDQVASATQRDVLLEYLLREHGVSLPDLRAATIELRLADPDIPEGVKEILRTRLDACATSISKYKALQNCTVNGKLKGALQFAGAGRTARWGGRLVQPQNLPKPWIQDPDALPRKKSLSGARLYDTIKAGIEILKLEAEDSLVDHTIDLAVSAIRSTIIAPSGKKLVVSDLSNIEGRAQAWLAGEEWKLQAFRDFDTVQTQSGSWVSTPQLHAWYMKGKYPKLALDSKGELVRKGPDLYKLAYAKSFGVSHEKVTKDQRQVGKVQELALGYAGGVGAFVNFASIYGIDLDALAAQAYDTLPDDIRDEAEGFYAWMGRQKRSTFGMDANTFVMCETFKRLWRNAHPNIAAHWKEIESAAVSATKNPGTTFTARKLKFRRDGSWLRMQLPSGRSLCYLHPQIDDAGQLSYMGLNQYTRQWQRTPTHGGKLFENACQAVARDVMAYNMPAIEAAYYEIVLTVHDEVVTYAPDAAEFTSEKLSAMLAANDSWSEGLPLAAAGYEDYVYKKE